MFGLSTLVSRILMAVVAVALLFGILWLHSCSQARQRAAESRVERAQGKATVESAKDAIATQTATQAKERASEDLTVKNAEEIRNAEGTNVKVAPGVNDAGLRSLCRRPSYHSSERCRVFRAREGLGETR
jgi:maltose-binding protein MalE